MMSRAFFKKLIFTLPALIIIAPLLALLYQAVSNPSDVFLFLTTHVLDDVIVNTLFVAVMTGIGVLIFGLSCAWFTAQYRFPGSKIFNWLLLIPLAFPAYIMAYTYTDFFDAAGPLATSLRDADISTSFLPNMRNVGGASFILTFCLYPYVYLFAQNSFLSGSKSQLENSKMLGASKFHQFFEIALPAARPSIIVGLMIVMMEVLADYGTMDYFGIKVFSTVIYDSWAGYGDITAAARLSLIMLGFVLILTWAEKTQRNKMRFYNLGTPTTLKHQKLPGHIFMSLWCLIPVTVGFIFPALLLIHMALNGNNFETIISYAQNTAPYFMNTFTVASIVAVIGVFISYMLATSKRENRSRLTNALFNFCGFGYALPGIILGLGLLLVSSLFIKANILITGTTLFLILGYLIRFLNISLKGIEAGYEKISPSIDQASALMNNNKFENFRLVRLPLLLPTLLSSALLLAVEVIKELPLTLILRPFDFDTLAIHTYNLASDERLTEAAFPALCIVTVSCLPILLLTRVMRADCND